MSIFPPHDIETMNEDDVSGELVRPFCRALGYSQGNPKANLRSQISLRYGKAFLGHKNGARDPEVRGRPDFVCEVVSYTRWVIEAKKPSIELSQDDSYQAHTYATHPEIAAEFYLLTNGREFRLYRIANPDAPLMSWKKEETDGLMPVLENILGPDAMKRRANVKIDLGKPIARGYGSEVEIVGGSIVYEKTEATIPLAVNVDGLVNHVSGRSVKREDTGLIKALVDVESAFKQMQEIHDRMGFNPIQFQTSDEYISSDIDKPTLMQSILTMDFAAGSAFPQTPITPGGILPCRVAATCYTDAVGFMDGDKFLGSFFISYDYDIGVPEGVGIPKHFKMSTEGKFDIRLRTK